MPQTKLILAFLLFLPSFLLIFPVLADERDTPTIGDSFKDCDLCPEMLVIPAGAFIMGSEKYDNEEKPAHQVTISKPFALSKFELTLGNWIAVMGSTSNDESHDHYPVFGLSFYDVEIFIERFNAMLGLEGNQKYRLPSEAEWEYAARAGSITSWSCGDHEDCLDNDAWYALNSSDTTHPVGQKQPNSFGLYDMYGNVSEWVADCWTRNYETAPIDGSTQQNGECHSRVVRGSSFYYYPNFLRATYRSYKEADLRDGYTGFRLAKSLDHHH